MPCRAKGASKALIAAERLPDDARFIAALLLYGLDWVSKRDAPAQIQLDLARRNNIVSIKSPKYTVSNVNWNSQNDAIADILG